MPKEEQKKDVDNLIQMAKWQMYGEEWTDANRNLLDAKRKAIEIKDKERIDIILDLIKKASNQEKVQVS